MKPTPLALIIGTVCHCAPLCAQELAAQATFTPIVQSSLAPGEMPSSTFHFRDEHAEDHDKSLWQSAGRAASDGIKTLGKLIARGDWSDDFNPATPRSPRLGLMADSKHHRFWYYRLQNRVLSAQSSEAEADPDFPELIPNDNPRDQPAPPLPQPARLQIPAYAALPAAFTSLEENLQTLFMHDAQLAGLDGRPDLFIAWYNGKDRQHAAVERFDAESRYHGWLIGTRWAPDEDTPLGLSLALHKGHLTMVPQAQQGISSSHFTTQGINALMSWQPAQGLQLALPLAATQYRGDVSISAEGKVARVRAQGDSIGLETGWRWQSGHHALTPVAGLRAQWLDIDGFRDKDALQVSYQQQHELQFSGGIKYDYQPTDTLRFGTEVRYVQRSHHHGRVTIGKEGDFRTGRGGNSVQVSSYAGLQLADNLQLNLQMQTQQRLTREGVSDWNVQAGLRMSF